MVWLAHVLVTAFFVVAWALPFRWALWVAAIGAPIMHAQWRLNDECVLTTLERRLRDPGRRRGAGESSFLTELVRRLCGRDVPGAWVSRLSYAILWGGAGLASLRLAAR